MTNAIQREHIDLYQLKQLVDGVTASARDISIALTFTTKTKEELLEDRVKELEAEVIRLKTCPYVTIDFKDRLC